MLRQDLHRPETKHLDRAPRLLSVREPLRRGDDRHLMAAGGQTFGLSLDGDADAVDVWSVHVEGVEYSHATLPRDQRSTIDGLATIDLRDPGVGVIRHRARQREAEPGSWPRTRDPVEGAPASCWAAFPHTPGCLLIASYVPAALVAYSQPAFRYQSVVSRTPSGTEMLAWNPSSARALRVS